jgi:hypothetical protein
MTDRPNGPDQRDGSILAGTRAWLAFAPAKPREHVPARHFAPACPSSGRRPTTAPPAGLTRAGALAREGLRSD